ncbi:hypothetical protein CRM22_004381 [Opisthorchis felineus]|uniref:RING-type E3 ubiquitin transferase n=1 Tax=Opisthorchis felineus TaxID=147828 RepID=A0A4S2LWE9_OPIFE|nr:hypothetical protein CRM22_004381 [Opisthorchis felineus]
MAHSVFPDGLSYKPRHLNRAFTEPGRAQAGAPVICYVSHADNSVLQVEVEHRAVGQDVLDKICRELGIVEEAEYFGIQFVGNKNEILWVNNRNRLSKQLSSSPPYHFYFRVKFFIPPEDILLEGTRHQFYINVVRQLKEGVWDAEMNLQTQAHLIALMAYVQFGKYNQNTTPCKYACFWPDSRGEIPPDAIGLAANFHRALDGFTIQHVQYELLRLAATEVPSYGMHFYEVKDIFERRLTFGVGPEGLVLCNTNYTIDDKHGKQFENKCKFPYCRVQTITTSSRVVTLNLLEDDGSVKARNYQLASPRLASSLYRLVNEVYAFFRCDSVRKEVLSQTRRDILDAISFHHNGKEYAFDVRYTSREVYDRARRHLYHCTSNTAPHESPPNYPGMISGSLGDPSNLSSTNELGAHRASGDVGLGSLKREYSSRADSFVTDEELQEIVQKCLWEIGLCRICVDAPISRVFLPCGHIICCVDCAERIEQCSVCRQDIMERHQCFLPWNTEPSFDHLIHSETQRLRRQSTRSEASNSALSTAGNDIPHTASAPTCSLFSLPSTTCVDPSLPRKPNVSDDETPAPTSVDVAVDAPGAKSSGISSSSTETPTPCDTPVHKTASTVRPLPSNPTATTEQSPSDARQSCPTSAAGEYHPGGSVSTVPRISPPRRPTHVSWQLSD